MPYLSYLSLVRGVGLDYDVLLGRTFASPFTNSVHNGGLGVDVELFDVMSLGRFNLATHRPVPVSS